MPRRKLHKRKPKSPKKRTKAQENRYKRQSCTRKIAYDDKKEAHEMRRFHDDGLVVYKCKFCGKFHIGHK